MSEEQQYERVCAVILAAGRGERLRPLTDLVPKPLVPVGDGTPLAAMLRRLAQLGFAGPTRVAVNAHHLADQIVATVGSAAYVNVERPAALGTAGAIAALSTWIDGRDVLICNADAYLDGEVSAEMLSPSTAVRLLVTADAARGDFGAWRFAGISYLPARFVDRLRAVPSDLYREVWRDEYVAGRLSFTEFTGVFFDCGTPAEYQAANQHASRSAASS